MKNLIPTTLGLILVLVSTAVFADRVFQTSEMLTGPNSNKPFLSPQGAAWLRRSPKGVDGRVMVKVDQANTPYSIWFIAFNNPENCAGASLNPPEPCGVGDLLFNKDAVGGAVFNASGAISSHNGADAGGVINVDIEVVAGEGSGNGHAGFPPIPAEFCEGCLFLDLNGVLKKKNGCGAEIHFDVNQHAIFDEGWVTELTQPEGDAHRFAIFPAVDCKKPKKHKKDDDD